MLDLHASSVQLGSFLGGNLLHVVAYRKGEWDLLVPKLYNDQSQDGLAASVRVVAFLGAYHALGIALSMVTYRILFHRLTSFPGPFLARVSNFYVTALSSKRLHLFAEVEALHKQYGDYVRLGPSELSIIDPNALTAIYAAKSPCSKGPFYNVLHPRMALNMIRDRPEHTKRRKDWDRGFSSRALRDYEPRVVKYTDQLVAHIQSTQGTPVNVSDWFNFYSFDVMGDLAFGKSFNMLRDGIKHYFMNCLHADMQNIGYLAHLTWLFPFLKITPVLNTEHLKFWSFCTQQVAERRKIKPDRPDIFSWLLESFEANVYTKAAELNLIGDAYLIVVAGSDTTAATLTCLFYELATHRAKLEKLQTEIDAYFKEVETPSNASLSKLPYLDGVINETLRLHPPTPSGLQRQTPPEGLTVGNVFIPGNTLVQVPMHTLFRDDRSFQNASEFIPERWTTQSELTKNVSVFTPFSIGLYSCVGKQLALTELRHVISQLVHRFDIEVAPGQSTEAFLEGKKDTFTLALGPLNLVFTERKHSSSNHSTTTSVV
ncbi:uncharacterized protein BP5553_10415 [Venustampulla echinocandica]|uniref:Cytochrome P450 n=1 Tax=Venustampulla echinocandica TaxID=2656787 RepID=A0A370T985_9HELO|nr:uncharacterized protein BP5553_10415 [Venustampulla echinocandica]RDL30137.1 hypothetical protein BP5553_10415 [Venustampulla echinocandica]